MRRRNIMMALVWILLAVVLTYLLVSKISEKGSDKNKNLIISFSPSSLQSTKNFDANKVENLFVDLTSESFYLENTNGNSIIVELYGNEKSIPSVNINNNTLEIKSEVHIGINFGEQKVVVKIPNNCKFDDVNVKSLSGALHVSEVAAKNVIYKSSSGSIHVNDGIVESGKIESQSGSVSIINCDIIKLDASSVSGSLKFAGSTDQFDLASVSGSVRVDLNKPFVNESKMESTSGSLHLNIPKNTNCNVDYKCTSGSYTNSITSTRGKSGVDVMGNGGPVLMLKSTSGSIHID